MRSRRLVVLVGSLFVALVAGVLTYMYVNGVKQETEQSAQLVDVLVATQRVPRGTTADAALAGNALGTTRRRRIDLPADAVTRPEDIKGQLAAIDLQPNEVITRSKFVTDAQLTVSKSTNLDKGNVGVAVATDKIAGVANLLQPGDTVNLMYAPDASAAAAAGPPAGLGLLYQGVRVLAVDQNLGSSVAVRPAAAAPGQAPVAGSSTTKEAATLVVQVPPRAAALIAAAEKSGSVYATLVRQDYETVVLDADSPFPGDRGETPYGTAAPPTTEANDNGG